MEGSQSRPSCRVKDVVDVLLEQIVGGALPPGSRLPLRTELQATFGASAQTVHLAVEQLAGHSFVRTRGRLGTFVVENPPHLNRYGLVFRERPSDLGRWRQFWTELASQAKLSAEREDRFLPFLHAAKGHKDLPACLNLLRDLV